MITWEASSSHVQFLSTCTYPKRPRNAHRQQALYQAFVTLDMGNTGRLPRDLVAHVLRRLKPRYEEQKIQVRRFVER